MKILKDSLFSPFESHRIHYTLRGDGPLIPTLQIGGSIKLDSIPESWVEYLAVCNFAPYGFRRILGKEQGFLHLSKKGYEDNLEEIKDFCNTENPNIPFSDIDIAMQKFFKDVDRYSARHKAKQMAKLQKTAKMLKNYK